MAYARAVTFEGVDRSRIDRLTQQLKEDERPEEIPASEIILLYDADGEKSLVLVFFETEDDYRRGDAALNAVRQWKYTPTLLNGVPVPIVMTVTVNFTLQGR